MENDYRKKIYKDYADVFKNSSGLFDQETTLKWQPCLEYYLRNWLPIEKNSPIIDLGCGEGRVIYLLKRMDYTNVKGVDISESQLKIARQVNDRVESSDVLEYLQNTTEKYDIILAFDLIEHLSKNEVLDFINLCKMRLNIHGRLVLQTPNASSPFFGEVRYGDFTHELGFTPKLLSQLLIRAGFTNIESRETGPIPRGYSLKSTIRFGIWQIIRTLFWLITLIETGGDEQRIYTRVFIQSGVKKDD